MWDIDAFEGDLESQYNVMVREGLTNNTFASCSWPKYRDDGNKDTLGKWTRDYDNTDRISRGCVIDALLNKAAETKWLATNLLNNGVARGNLNTLYLTFPYLTFTRTTYTV